MEIDFNTVDIPAMLRDMRDKMELTQKQVGQAVGLSDRTINKYEHGGAIPGIDMLKKLALFMGYEMIVTFRKTHRRHGAPQITETGKYVVFGDGPYAMEVIGYRRGVEADYFSKDTEHKMYDAVDANLGAVLGVADPTTKEEIVKHNVMMRKHILGVVSPSADIANDAQVSKAVNIGPLSTVGHGCNIASYVSICSGVHIGHGTAIHRYATICPGAIISGDCLISRAAFIGAGACIKQEVVIGARSVVGMGAVVLEDVAEGQVVVGVPARPLSP